MEAARIVKRNVVQANKVPHLLIVAATKLQFKQSPRQKSLVYPPLPSSDGICIVSGHTVPKIIHDKFPQ